MNQYHCKDCLETSYVHWHKPINPHCWNCGSDNTEQTDTSIGIYNKANGTCYVFDQSKEESLRNILLFTLNYWTKEDDENLYPLLRMFGEEIDD